MDNMVEVTWRTTGTRWMMLRLGHHELCYKKDMENIFKYCIIIVLITICSIFFQCLVK